MFYLLSFLPKLGQLLLELHDTLALLSVAILRPIPVNLLAGFAAVAVGLASFTEFAGGGIQWDAAYLAGLAQVESTLLHGLKMSRITRNFSPALRSDRQPKFCLCESIQQKAAIHCVTRTSIVVLESRFGVHH